MKFLLLFLLALPALSAAAQHRKAPDNQLSDEPSGELEEDYLKAGIHSMSYVELTSEYGEPLDTTHEYDFRFDAKGRTIQSQDYDYGSPHEREKEEAKGDLILSAVATNKGDGTRITYTHDSAGRVVRMQITDFLPAGTVSSLTTALMTHFLRRQREHGEGEEEEESPAASKRQQAQIRHFIDSFQASHPQDILRLRNEYIYTYDPDGNVLTKEDPVEQNSTRYSYEYDREGRVITKQGNYISDGNGRASRYYSGEAVQYTYTPDGKVAASSLYIAERDTTNVIQEKNLRRRQSTHYNSAGDPDTITYREGSSVIQHILAYQGRRCSAYTILTIRYGGKRDTTSYTTHRYDGDHEVESISRSNVYEKVARIIREKTFYNSRGLPVETVRTTEETGSSSSDKSVVQMLYFYGNAAEDRVTAARKRRLDADLQKARIARYKKEQAQRSKPIVKKVAPAPPANLYGDLMPAPGVVMAGASTPNVFRMVEQMPRFNGDIAQYLASNLKYPAAAKDTAARVFVQFVVTDDGSIKDAVVVRAANDPAFNAEALRVVMAMPRWMPGKQNGQPVNTFFTLPIVFSRRQ